MKRKMITVVLILCLAVTMPVFSWGTGPAYQVNLEGAGISGALESQVQQLLQPNELTGVNVPLRLLAEAFGHQVSWDGTNQQILLEKEGRQIQLQIGSDTVLLDEVPFSIPVPVYLKEDRSYVPLSLFSRGLGLIVGWDQINGSISIREAKEPVEAFFTLEQEAAQGLALDTYLSALESYENFNGSVLVARDGKVLLSKGYGSSNRELGIFNASQTRFAIGSVTKQFTALAIFQLIEQGLVVLDQTIDAYLPDFPHGLEITVQQLLTHTSGLVNYTNFPQLYFLEPEKQNTQGILEVIGDQPLQFTPGSRYEYNNTGYYALGLIVEAVTGLSYEAYLQTHVFGPLGMNHTGQVFVEAGQHYDATPYVGFLEQYFSDDTALLKVAGGAGALVSTVEDLYRWDQALNTEQLLKAETLEQLFTGQVEAPGLGQYAYGWMVTDTPYGRLQFHNGITLGFAANIARYVDQELTIVVLANNRTLDTIGLTGVLANIVLDQPYELPQPIQEIELEEYGIYDAYVGTYDTGLGLTITITREGSQLFSQITGDGVFEIYPQTPQQFFYKVVKAKITFMPEASGEVNQLLFEQSGLQIPAVRIEKQERIVAPVDPAIYDTYAGRYELFPGAEITIERIGDSIFATMTGQETFEIFPESETDYFYTVVDAQITFVKDDAGQVVGLVIHQSGQSLPASKLE